MLPKMAPQQASARFQIRRGFYPFALFARNRQASHCHAFYNKQADVNSISNQVLKSLKEFYYVIVNDVFGLQAAQVESNDVLGDVVEILINLRKEARQNKNFGLSDQIRDELKSRGVQLKDEKDGKTCLSIFFIF